MRYAVAVSQYPSKIKSEIEKDLSSPILSALETEGISPARLAKKLNEELDANETKFFQHQGEVVDEREVIAWEVRQRARIDAHKLLNHYPAEETRVSGSLMVEIVSYADSEPLNDKNNDPA